MSAAAEQLNSEKPHIPASALEMAGDAKRTLSDVKAITISSDQQYEVAALDLKSIKDKQRQMDTERKSITRPLDEAKKAIMNFFREPEGFLKDAERILKRGMMNYQDDKRKQAEKERKRQEEARRKEEERLAREAEELEKEGDHATAEAVLEQAASIPAPIVEESAPKVEGVKTQVRWSAELEDKMTLIKAVAEGKVPDIALDVNMKFLRQQAVSLKDALAIPGVKAVKNETIAA